MKVVGLVSGGKDSCFAMMKCLEYGHQVVALANLLAANDYVDELDSYMYQTVLFVVDYRASRCKANYSQSGSLFVNSYVFSHPLPSSKKKTVHENRTLVIPQSIHVPTVDEHLRSDQIMSLERVVRCGNANDCGRGTSHGPVILDFQSGTTCAVEIGSLDVRSTLPVISGCCSYSFEPGGQQTACQVPTFEAQFRGTDARAVTLDFGSRTIEPAYEDPPINRQTQGSADRPRTESVTDKWLTSNTLKRVRKEYKF